VTQIDYYTETVKRMVGKVLNGNGITRYKRGTYDLVGGEELSDAERDQMLELCRQRFDAFREQRGEEVFAHRSRHPWRWTTSCPGTRAVRTTSATCRLSASAATPPSDGRRAVCFAGWRSAAGCCWRTNWRCASPMPTR
jgi:hypothetical protein